MLWVKKSPISPTQGWQRLTSIPYDVPMPSERVQRVIDGYLDEIEVNRVVYDITSKPPDTIEWE